MGVWESYESRFDARRTADEPAKRGKNLTHAQEAMLRMMTSTLMYHVAKNGDEELRIAVIDDANDVNKKKVFSMPGEDLPHGSVIDWADAKWLITDVNIGNDLYTKGYMHRCNHFLRWIDEDGNIIGRWCYIEDGTKYLIGEHQKEILTIGDARIGLTIGKDRDTDKLTRGMRFLIDDPDSKDVLAYQITKPNRLYNVYNGRGVFKFILNEVNKTDNDNEELRIADYYNWAPKKERPKPDSKVEETFVKIAENAREKEEHKADDIRERKVWL